MTTCNIDQMYITEEGCRGERWRSRDGQRKHDAGTTDHRGRGQEHWRSTCAAREAKAAAIPGLLQEMQQTLRSENTGGREWS